MQMSDEGEYSYHDQLFWCHLMRCQTEVLVKLQRQLFMSSNCYMHCVSANLVLKLKRELLEDFMQNALKDRHLQNSITRHHFDMIVTIFAGFLGMYIQICAFSTFPTLSMCS